MKEALPAGTGVTPGESADGLVHRNGPGPPSKVSTASTLAALVPGLAARKKVGYRFAVPNTFWKNATAPFGAIEPKATLAPVRLGEDAGLLATALMIVLVVWIC